MSKKLIVCADGTWNSDNEIDSGHPQATNVAKLARALLPTAKASDGGAATPQLVYYEPGVGTSLGIRLRGGALGRGIFDNVLDCYRFLVHNFEPGDELYFFGFSRGAYTVRSLAGLVRNSGILKRGHESSEKEAVALYRDYSDDTKPDGETSIRFRAEHSHTPDIRFIGVWDTVGALGIPGLDGRFRLLRGLDWQFHDVTLSSIVKNAFHALAIHEHRAEFLPTLWEQQPGMADQQRLEQVWFSGAHSDVGGGYPEAGLSDIALDWMIDAARKYGGLEFDLQSFEMRPDFRAKGHDSFGTFYKVLDWIDRKKNGTLREFLPKPETQERLHESVIERALNNSEEKWPQTFKTEIDRQIGVPRAT